MVQISYWIIVIYGCRSRYSVLRIVLVSKKQMPRWGQKYKRFVGWNACEGKLGGNWMRVGEQSDWNACQPPETRKTEWREVLDCSAVLRKFWQVLELKFLGQRSTLPSREGTSWIPCCAQLAGSSPSRAWAQSKWGAEAEGAAGASQFCSPSSQSERRVLRATTT